MKTCRDRKKKEKERKSRSDFELLIRSRCAAGQLLKPEYM